jgi:hypothetical protein
VKSVKKLLLKKKEREREMLQKERSTRVGDRKHEKRKMCARESVDKEETGERKPLSRTFIKALTR